MNYVQLGSLSGSMQLSGLSFIYLSLHTYIVLTLNEDHNEVKIVA